eukprot:TRINITY_DN28381_c0_g1_i1.p1 TRINITY_DN28381_c0_g1~~TRINITY_DN28381_c0_g1_i1.p1  ORF type:complete len:358 (+),score=80.14 TRINITY_DN28381_c0_g1_i1:40-1113(+)
MRAWGERDDEPKFTTRRKSTGWQDEACRSQETAARRVTLAGGSGGPRAPRRSYSCWEAEKMAQHYGDCWKAEAWPDDTVKPEVSRQWVTLKTTTWHLAPSCTSCKLGELPQGRLVTELASARPLPNWLAVQPRGFVSRQDVAPSENPGEKLGREDVQPADMLVAAHDALHLREQTVSLKEKALAAKQELDSILQAREAVAQELAMLEEQRSLESQKLEAYRQRRMQMKEKLQRCSDVIAFTVDAMDRVHEQPVRAAQGAVASCLAELDECEDRIYLDGPERVVDQKQKLLEAPVSHVDDVENQPMNARKPACTPGSAEKKQSPSSMTKLDRVVTDKCVSKEKQPMASRAPLQALNIR